MSADPLAAAVQPAGSSPPRIRLGRRGRVVALKMNGRVDLAGRGWFRFPPVRPTPRNPVRSLRASPPGPSQEPLDGRNLATLGSLGPRRAAGGMALDSGDRLADFRGRRRRRSVRIGVLPRTSSGGLSLNGPGAWRAPSHNRAGPCRFCEALPMDRSMNGGAIATRAPAVREPSEAR